MKRRAVSPQWRMLIRYAERQLNRSRVKTMQLEALVRDFRRKAAKGEPSPFDVVNDVQIGSATVSSHAERADERAGAQAPKESSHD